MFTSCFLCFVVLFQSSCSHAQAFGTTLVHEFHIYSSQSEWYLLFWLGEKVLAVADALSKIEVL